MEKGHRMFHRMFHGMFHAMFHEMLHGMEHHITPHRQPKHKKSSKANYGQDVPVFVFLFFIIGLFFIVLGTVLFIVLGESQPILAAILGVLLGVIGLSVVAGGLTLIWASRSGKYQMRDRIMGQLDFRGDEQVLDVGCGAGLLLIGAARRLTSGKATGVDIWDKNLEYGNSPDNVRENARIEGVADRIVVRDGNACNLPFPDGSFDLVTSSNMLHHLSKDERTQAVREMARVLKSGGKLVIAEIAFTKQFVQVLSECGLKDIQDVPLNLFLWHRLVATK